MAHEIESQTRTVSAGGGVVVFDDVEMVIEGRDFVDFGRRQVQLVRECDEQCGGKVAARVLDAMQVFDQAVATQVFVTQQPP